MMDMVKRELQRMRASMRDAVRGVVQRIEINRRVQRVNVEALAGEQLQDVELVQHFGFTSAPPVGSQVIVVPLGGRTSASVVVATEHGAYRFVLGAAGEAALYNQWGDVIHLQADRCIRIVAAAKVRLETPLVEITGNVTVAGTVTAAVDVLGGGVSLKTHTHGGVQPGGGNTGGPN